jgi:uncharacterized protein YkwD
MVKVLSAYCTAFLATAAFAAPDLAEVEALVVRSTNEFRAEQGRGRLAPDPALTRAARGFADFMARTDQYGHQADGKEPSDRARERGYGFCMISENIAHQFTTGSFATAELARRFVESWKGSPGHRRNMLEEAATDIGAAVAHAPKSGRYYGVQMFGRPSSRMIEFRVTNVSRRSIDYRVGSKAWRLAASEGRAHKLCVPEEVSFPQAESGKGRTIRPSGGENLVAGGDARITIERR